MNEIAIIEQLPIITEQLKKIGEELDKRLADLTLDKLVCNEDSRKSIKNLRTELGKELESFEEQRKTIKKKIEEPYKIFEEAYKTQIKSKYEDADLILKEKIDEVETGIKENIKNMMIDYFNEYRQSKNIDENYVSFDDLNVVIKLDYITDKGALTKKAKDEVSSYLDKTSIDLETISTMQYNNEILVEYLKCKNISLAIKEVNDRHYVLEQVQKQQEILNQSKIQEEKAVEIVDNVLSAPTEIVINGQMTIEDFEEECERVMNVRDEEIVQATFVVTGTTRELLEVREFLRKGGYTYECK